MAKYFVYTIKVRRCGECPHFSSRKEVCVTRRLHNRPLEDSKVSFNQIPPDWCPLLDSEEVLDKLNQ